VRTTVLLAMHEARETMGITLDQKWSRRRWSRFAASSSPISPTPIPQPPFGAADRNPVTAMDPRTLASLQRRFRPSATKITTVTTWAVRFHEFEHWLDYGREARSHESTFQIAG
jgi:hypothetical protein